MLLRVKKCILSLVVCGIVISSFAQSVGGSGFEIGIRGAAASNWLFNASVASTGQQDYSAALSYNYGIDMAYDFSERFALEVNLLIGNTTQGYNGTFDENGTLPYNNEAYIATESFNAKTQLNLIGIPILMRFGSGNGAYIELGTEIQIITSATYSISFTDVPSNAASYSGSVKNAFAPNSVSGVLGFGDDFQLGSSGLNIITDLRFYYDLTDMRGVDGFGQNLNVNIDGYPNTLYTAPYGSTGKPYYAGYKPTKEAGASFSIGLYYFFGGGGDKHPSRR